MTRVAALIRDHGAVPPELRPQVDAAIEARESDAPDPALLADMKAALWAYLVNKHGDTTTLADAYDRSVRAALCLTEAFVEDPADLLDWATPMLGAGER